MPITREYYSLRGFCDNVDDHWVAIKQSTSMVKYNGHIAETEFTGRNRNEALHNAKLAKWIFTLSGEVYCPYCVENSKF